MRIFQISQLKLRNSSFKQNWLFLHQNSLRNSILIRFKNCLSILEILDFALNCDALKKLVHELLRDFHFNINKLEEMFGLVPKQSILML